MSSHLPNRVACAFSLLLLFAAACGSDSGTTPPPPTPTIPNLHGIGGWTEFDLFAVGDAGTILHYQGAKLHTMASHTTSNLRDVTGWNSTNAYAVGDGGTILHWDGSIWTGETSHTRQNLNSLWGTAADNLIAVGSSGVILSRSGAVWNIDASPVRHTLNGVYALAPSGEAYAVGDSGAVAHRVGGVWSAVPPFTGSRLRSIWADKPRDWFAVGDNGEIWQERGAGWHQMVSPRTDDFYSIFGSDSAFVFVAGAADSILFYDGFDWRPVAPRHADRLEGIWATVCALPPSPVEAAAGFHCSNTYFAGNASVVTRFTLLGSYENLNDPR
jgi:hypothetical protein